jgi:hypothetical protein
LASTTSTVNPACRAIAVADASACPTRLGTTTLCPWAWQLGVACGDALFVDPVAELAAD